MSGGGICRLGESALDMVEEVWGREHRLGESALESKSSVEEEDTDWERAHCIGWEWCGGER